MLRRKPAKRIGSQHASSGRSGSLGRSLGQVVVVSQQRQREATTTWHILCVLPTPTPPLSLSATRIEWLFSSLFTCHLSLLPATPAFAPLPSAA